MDNTTKLALIAGAALLLIWLFSSSLSGASPGRARFLVDEEPVRTAFISPSGGASTEFVPVEDGDMVYSAYP